MIYLSKKYHNYEYKESRKANFVFFILVFVHQVGLYVLKFEDFYEVERQELEYEIDLYIPIWLYIFNATPIFVGCTVIYAKDSRDLIQGISKLDYLLIVSIFQRNTADDLRKTLMKAGSNIETSEDGSSSRDSLTDDSERFTTFKKFQTEEGDSYEKHSGKFTNLQYKKDEENDRAISNYSLDYGDTSLKFQTLRDQQKLAQNQKSVIDIIESRSKSTFKSEKSKLSKYSACHSSINRSKNLK